MERKPVVLVFVGFYLPGYRGGGPIRSIANMVDRLSDEFDFRIVTRDRDLGDKVPYTSIDVNCWNLVGKAKVFYLDSSSFSLFTIFRLIRNTYHDVLYLNSFFDTRFTWAALLSRRLLGFCQPVVLAPRGEFSEGAVNLKKWKKAPFLRLVHLSGLLDKVLWHASTKLELVDIVRVVGAGGASICVAENISIAPDLVARPSLDRDRSRVLDLVPGPSLRVCFLSRISPMKNLDFALRVLRQIKVGVEFNIYGPIELPSYWALCESLIGELPAHVHVSYLGSVENS